MKAAYADPPYLGCGAKHYAAHHADAADADSVEWHEALIDRLNSEFDSWALSMSSTNLPDLVPLLPAGVRIGAWVKPFCSFKANVTRAFAWEPVAFKFHRKRSREKPTWRDYVSHPITLRRGLPGAKPDAFCYWIFDGLGLEPQDEFIDLFPGTGGVMKAYEKWTARWLDGDLCA